MSGGSGCVSKTSSAAPPDGPSRSAVDQAASSITGPARDVDQHAHRASSRRCARRRAGPRVSSVSGQQSTTMSACATKRVERQAPRHRRAASRAAAWCAITRMPKPPGRSGQRLADIAEAHDAQRPPAKIARHIGMFARRRPSRPRRAGRGRSRGSGAAAPCAVKITCSATVEALTPGTLATSTPAAVACLHRDHVEPRAMADRRRAGRRARAKYPAGRGARTTMISAPVPSARKRRGGRGGGDAKVPGGLQRCGRPRGAADGSKRSPPSAQLRHRRRLAPARSGPSSSSRPLAGATPISACARLRVAPHAAPRRSGDARHGTGGMRSGSLK